MANRRNDAPCQTPATLVAGESGSTPAQPTQSNAGFVASRVGTLFTGRTSRPGSYEVTFGAFSYGTSFTDRVNRPGSRAKRDVCPRIDDSISSPAANDIPSRRFRLRRTTKKGKEVLAADDADQRGCAN